MTYKVVVAGGRDFSDYELLKSYLDEFLADKEDIQIVSGGASGADTLGEKYAMEKNLSIRVFLADWQQFGKSAGYKRNAQMAEYGDACVAFWDGKSKGTKHMIDLANTFKLTVEVVKYE